MISENFVCQSAHFELKKGRVGLNFHTKEWIYSCNMVVFVCFVI